MIERMIGDNKYASANVKILHPCIYFKIQTKNGACYLYYFDLSTNECFGVGQISVKG